MVKAKIYTSEEKAVAAKAFVSATQSRPDATGGESVVGTNQTKSAFIQSFLDAAKAMHPVCDSGTYWRRGKAFWEHTRDKILFDVQNNFMPSYRHVTLAIVTGGFSEQNIINMSVANMLGKCKGADVKFAEFDANEWNNYAAYLVLKRLPKFQFVHGKYGVGNPDTLMDSSIDDEDSSNYNESKSRSRGNGFGQKKNMENEETR
jgi:hypothetical protein